MGVRLGRTTGRPTPRREHTASHTRTDHTGRDTIAQHAAAPDTIDDHRTEDHRTKDHHAEDHRTEDHRTEPSTDLRRSGVHDPGRDDHRTGADGDDAPARHPHRDPAHRHPHPD
ncbi:MAG: hypothetical protein H7231_03590 [Rhodoferax sp.]|nr:hypothetical protein [Actinomycetota bacterium]